MIKNFFTIFLLYCLSCSWYSIAMEKHGRDDEVKRIWIPQAALALTLIEKSEKTNNWVRYRNGEDTAGSFNAKLDQASIYVYRNPEKRDERVEVNYKIEDFKKLLKEPLPSPRQDDGPVEGRLEEKNECSLCLCFCCCCNH